MYPSMFLLLIVLVHSTSSFASFFLQSLFESLKCKISLPFFLMSLEVGFLPFHLLFVSLEAPIFIKLLQTEYKFQFQLRRFQLWATQSYSYSTIVTFSSLSPFVSLHVKLLALSLIFLGCSFLSPKFAPKLLSNLEV